MIHLYYFRFSDWKPVASGKYLLFMCDGTSRFGYYDVVLDRFQVPHKASFIPEDDIEFWAEIPSLRTLQANEGNEP